MARIQVDFDQVMLFGDLHGDISRALDSYRSVFGQDAARLDRIIDEFGLPRSTSNAHFAGQTIAYSLGNASERAHRVSSSLRETSTRIFRHANVVVDDHFDWSAVLSSPFVDPLEAALELAGNELIHWTEKAIAAGRLTSPVVKVLGPVFGFVTGGLSFYEGWNQWYDNLDDYWESVSAALKMVGGVVAIGATVAGLVVASPVVLIAAGVAVVLGGAALVIDHREVIGNLIGFDSTRVESSSDLLAGANGWSVPLAPAGGPTIVAEFDGADVGRLANPGSGTTMLQGSAGILLQGTRPAPARDREPAAAPTAAPFGPSAPLAGAGRSEAQILAAYRSDYVGKYGLAPGGSADGVDRFQCVSWAWFRMRELGFTGEQTSVGHGGRMAGVLGGTTSTRPLPGAVLSYRRHVVIAEQLTPQPDGSVVVRVSEMNSDADAATALPHEYRESMELTLSPDGTWRQGDDTVTITVFNPPYGPPQI